MSDDIDFELSLASDSQLIDELSRRASSSKQHGMILVYGRPTEGEPEKSNGFINVSAQSAELVRHLMELLIQHFRLQGFSDGHVEVPRLRMVGENRLEICQESVQSDLSSPHVLVDFLQAIPGVESVATKSPGREFACLVDPSTLCGILESLGLHIVGKVEDIRRSYYRYQWRWGTADYIVEYFDASGIGVPRLVVTDQPSRGTEG